MSATARCQDLGLEKGVESGVCSGDLTRLRKTPTHKYFVATTPPSRGFARLHEAATLIYSFTTCLVLPYV